MQNIYKNSLRTMKNYFSSMNDEQQRNFKEFELLYDPDFKRLSLNVYDLNGCFDYITSYNNITYTQFIKLNRLFNKFNKNKSKFNMWGYITLKISLLI